MKPETTMQRLIRAAHSHGYEPYMVDDGEEVIHTTISREFLDAATAVELASVTFRRYLNYDKPSRITFVMVWENDGVECFADHTAHPVAELIIREVFPEVAP